MLSWMIKSMTAYGRGTAPTVVGKWIVEIHSVNRKTLDVNLLLPKEFLRFDLDVRGWIGEVLHRGQITVRISLNIEEGSSAELSSLQALKKEWEGIAQALGYSRETVTLSFLAQRIPLSGLVSLDEKEEELKKSLKEAVLAALKELLVMREREGKNLCQDIALHLQEMEKNVEKVRVSAPKAQEHFRQKLLERLNELVTAPKENEERVLREVVLYAEKSDVTEELTRLGSHIAQFRHYLKGGEKSVGRTLDFLTQEMHREINTTASKSLEAEMIQCAVAMKSSCEKIREQVQNIE